MRASEHEGTHATADPDQPFGKHDQRDHQQRAEEDVAEVAEPVLLAEHVHGQVDARDAEHPALQPLRHEDVERGAHDRPPT
jgi:hypothetical protein